MKYLPLIVRNLFRKKTRAFLTLGSIAVALFLFGLLVTVETALSQGVEVAGADRLVVINRVSLIQPLPIAYRDRLLQIPGVTAVTYASWFGGVYQDERNFFPQFAIDPESFLKMYPEYSVPPAQWKTFLGDREGCVVGQATAKRFGWKVGDRIPLRGTIFPGTWEFNLDGIYTGKRPDDDTTQFWFHRKYLEERGPEWFKGYVGWYVVRVDNPDHAVDVVKAIDARFANSAWETHTDTEKAFAASFAKQIGNIRFIILSIGGVVFFTLLLVTGNTMAMAVRERIGELAVLKTVGFTDAGVLGLVLAEALTLALLGGVIGLGLAKAFTLSGDPTGGLLPIFYLAPWKMALGLLLAAMVGVLSGIVPAVTAMRLKIVDALRRV
ncbi:MAG: ABC transporter permease [Acidobacteria bacterium]|nr:ABC transporter permease [Acidobacteriota bacterium]